VDDLFGPPISVYTRSQAIADGVLVDVSDTARQAGFTIPVAVTGTLWYEYIDLEPDTLPAGQSATGRLWDVLSLAAVAARRGADSDRVTFRVIFEMPDDRRETVKAIMTDRRRRPEWRTGDHDHATGRTIEMQVSITFEVDNAVFED